MYIETIWELPEFASGGGVAVILDGNRIICRGGLYFFYMEGG